MKHLDNLDHEAEGEWHGEEDEEDRDDDQQMCAHSLALLAR